MPFVDYMYKMKGLENYAGTFQLEYGIMFDDRKTLDIVDDPQLLDYLQTRICQAHNRLLGFSRLFIKNTEIWDLLEALRGMRTRGKSLVISHTDSPLFFA